MPPMATPQLGFLRIRAARISKEPGQITIIPVAPNGAILPFFEDHTLKWWHIEAVQQGRHAARAVLGHLEARNMRGQRTVGPFVMGRVNVRR